MENLKKLLSFLAPLPAWLRIVVVTLITIVASVCLMMAVNSCGITQSLVNNINSDNNTIEMGVTPSTTTSTTANPIINPVNN